MGAAKNVKINYKTLALSFSVFIFSAVVFSRLIILDLQNKAKTIVSDQPEDVQVLSLKDEELAEDELDVEKKVLPDDFPNDIPIFTGALLKDYWVNDSNGIGGVFMLWEIEQSLSEVVNYYKSEFKNLGWETTVILDDNVSFTMSFSKETVDGYIGITQEDGLTIISFTIGIKSEYHE
jgi:hypothetical protein